MFEVETEVAASLAREAGKIILAHYATEFLTEQKLGYNNRYEPVTIADKDASRLIVDGLTRAFPADAILSEEEADDEARRLASRRVWIIDPIDGTQGFVNREDDFAVQIGMIEDGVPVVGVVYLPAYDSMSYASRSGGAFCSNSGGEPYRLGVSNNDEISELTAALSKNHGSKRLDRICDAFRFKQITNRGSVGLKTGLITTQEADIYISPGKRTKIWDTCGPQVILEEAGGRMTDLFGYKLIYDRPNLQNVNGILATNGAVHDKAVARLAPLLSEFGRVREV